jgi:hypothetical protein
MVEIAKKRTQSDDKRVCSRCGSTETYTEKGKVRKDGTRPPSYPHWRRDNEIENGWVCSKCFNKYVINVNWRPLWDKRRFLFKDKPAYAPPGSIPRIGVCNWCRAVIGEINAQIGKLCKMTSIAHMAYHDDNPLKDTLELCAYCHTKYDSAVRLSAQ